MARQVQRQHQQLVPRQSRLFQCLQQRKLRKWHAWWLWQALQLLLHLVPRTVRLLPSVVPQQAPRVPILLLVEEQQLQVLLPLQ